jgi:hypothetical protein
MPDTSLYDLDFPTWSEQQADLLTRLARGERVNSDVDWSNVIEEVQALGRSEVRAVRSAITRALEHLLKIVGFPHGPVEHWAGEAFIFLIEARSDWAASMAQRVDLPDIYDDALQAVRRLRIDGKRVGDLPALCPLELRELIVPKPGAPEVDQLVEALKRSLASR